MALARGVDLRTNRTNRDVDGALGYTFTRDIGDAYEYSNLGFGLLGHALARQVGMT